MSTTPKVDFTEPAGEPSLVSADSVSWQVFKNPVALYIGGITATLLELAEPRIRAGVWQHSSFKTEPLTRLKRTGLAAMVTVFGARSTAEQMIAGITRLHAKVEGTTDDGQPYTALDPELMNWVHITASFGFLEAYCRFVNPLDKTERDRFYSEAIGSASLYGATTVPTSEDAIRTAFADIHSKLEATPVNDEFLNILRNTPSLPGLMRPFQGLFIKAAVAILPEDKKQQLGYCGVNLSFWQRWLIKGFAHIAERRCDPRSPAAQACVRVGLAEDYLYRR